MTEPTHGPTASDLHERAQGVPPEFHDAEVAASEQDSGADRAAATEVVSADDTSAPEEPDGPSGFGGGPAQDEGDSA